MAATDGLTFEGTLNALYADNTSNAISESDLRALPTAVRESFLNMIDHLSIISASTAGATITLDFGLNILSYEKKFAGSASFATAKAIALDNSTNAVRFEFIFEITDVAATLDFGAGSTFKMADGRFDASTQVWTALEIGTYWLKAVNTGTNWLMEINAVPYL